MTTQIEAPLAGTPETAAPAYPLVVLSHLGWDWVWQRPQHLLSRMSRQHPVLFVMEPWVTEVDHPPRLNIEERGPNLTLAWPVFSHAQAEEAGGVYKLVGQLIDERLAASDGPAPVYWLYTPMAWPAVADRAESVIVFDAMDELSAFRFAPAELKHNEAAVMQRADVVFAGGPSLYQARVGRNPNLHCFPSGVEREHFASAGNPEVTEPESISSLPHPRIGFYGVIDERTDLDLLRRVAELRPDYHWIMVGPTAKIDPAELPHLPNVHYPGKQGYAELPRFLKGFDICMMPFALNESTRFISPTKTLEYMAAHKPVVSTPVPDVVAPYGQIVQIASTAEEFVAAVDRAWNESPEQRAARIKAEDEVLAAQEWDTIAASMLQLISSAYGAKEQR